MSKLGQESILEDQFYFYAKEINQGGYISVFKEKKREAIYLLLDFIGDSKGNKRIFTNSFFEDKRKYRLM